MTRRDKHFFEVFQGLSQGVAPTREMDPITRSAPALNRPSLSNPMPVPDTPLTSASPGPVVSRPKYVVFRLTSETFVVLSLLFAGLLFVSFFWGYQRGANRNFAMAEKADPSGQEPVVMSGDPARAPQLNVANGNRPAGPNSFWTLRVWTGDSVDAAKALAAQLRTPDRETFVAPLTVARKWIVSVGRFDSKDAPEAAKLQKEFQEMVVKGDKPFRTCLLQKMTVAER